MRFLPQARQIVSLSICTKQLWQRTCCYGIVFAFSRFMSDHHQTLGSDMQERSLPPSRVLARQGGLIGGPRWTPALGPQARFSPIGGDANRYGQFAYLDSATMFTAPRHAYILCHRVLVLRAHMGVGKLNNSLSLSSLQLLPGALIV